MRVITGVARGHRLITLDGDDVRPTTDKVKEALFSIIQFEIEGRKVLDLFAGSGQLGIEALSRGAQNAVFVDKSKKSIEIVKANLEATKLSKNASVINSDSLLFLKTTASKFDLAFLDPPYSKGILQQAIEVLPRVMNDGAVIICESPESEKLPEAVGSFNVSKSYVYGKMKLTVYRQQI